MWLVNCDQMNKVVQMLLIKLIAIYLMRKKTAQSVMMLFQCRPMDKVSFWRIKTSAYLRSSGTCKATPLQDIPPVNQHIQ